MVSELSFVFWVPTTVMLGFFCITECLLSDDFLIAVFFLICCTLDAVMPVVSSQNATTLSKSVSLLTITALQFFPFLPAKYPKKDTICISADCFPTGTSIILSSAPPWSEISLISILLAFLVKNIKMWSVFPSSSHPLRPSQCTFS